MATRSPKLQIVDGKPQSRASLRAAAYELVPEKNKYLGGYDNRRLIDVMLNGQNAEAANLGWYFYERIPELRYIARYVANSLSMARLYIGKVENDPYNPKEVGERHPARKLLENFAGGTIGQAELLDRLGLHLTVAGDSILAGPTGEQGALQFPFDWWRIYSTYEMTARNGEIFYRGANTQETLLPAGVKPVRVWRPHPRWWWEADSATRSAFTVLREIDLLDQHVHATAVSRLSGAGVLGIPDELTLAGGGSETEIDGEVVDEFTRAFMEVAEIAIKNRESAAALIPIIFRGPAEFISKIQHFDFSTKFDERITEMRQTALRRLALGMDVPPEILTGMQDSNHWSAWQTDESTVRLHTKPLLQLIVGSLTQGWLRPALRNMRDLPQSVVNEIDNLVIWFNVDALRVQPDISAEVGAAYDRFEVGGDALRAYSGFDPQDKPTDKELARQILLKLVRDNNPTMVPYAIDALRELGLPFPDAKPIKADVPTGNVIDEGGEIIVPADKNPGPSPDTTQPMPAGNSTPGARSQAKQTSAPPAPPTSGDGNYNQ